MFDSDGTVDDVSGSELGPWLRDSYRELNRGEAAWLTAPGRFDAEAGWVVDGQFSGLEWLMYHARMSRATAYEKLRVAAELRRRPVMTAAFVGGEIGYSAVRLLTRVVDPDPDVDRALVDVARSGSVKDVEHAVRIYRKYADQEHPPPDPAEQRNARIVDTPDDTGELRVTLTGLEAEEVRVVLQGFIDQAHVQYPSPRGDSLGDLTHRQDVRADAYMTPVRTAANHAGTEEVPLLADRYLIHLVSSGTGRWALPVPRMRPSDR